MDILPGTSDKSRQRRRNTQSAGNCISLLCAQCKCKTNFNMQRTYSLKKCHRWFAHSHISTTWIINLSNTLQLRVHAINYFVRMQRYAFRNITILAGEGKANGGNKVSSIIRWVWMQEIRMWNRRAINGYSKFSKTRPINTSLSLYYSKLSPISTEHELHPRATMAE